MTKDWYRSYIIKALVVALVIGGIYYFLLPFSFFQTLKFSAEDQVAKLVYKQYYQHLSSDPITLIAIDNQDFQKIKKWPWSRELFGEFLKKLNKYHPKVVFFDVIFHGASPSGPEDDAFFEEALKEAGNVILASYFDKDWHYQIPLERFTQAAYSIGFVNKPRDLDLVVRRGRVLVFAEDHSVIDVSSEVKVVCKYLDIPLEELYLYSDHVELRKSSEKSINIPIRKDGSIPINYTLSKDNFNILNFWQILQDQASRELLENKIVLVSIISEVFHDQYNTPIDEDKPGAVIGGNILKMMLSEKFLYEFSTLWSMIIAFALAFLISLLTLRFSFLTSFGLLLLIWLGCFLGGYFLRTQNILIDFFSPLFLTGTLFSGISVYNYFKLLIRNNRLRQLAITDGLTGMFIYRYLVVRLKSELERAQRYNLELSFLIADIDHFKHFNDTYGHDIGNVVLKHFSQIIKENSRKTDFIARYGGEEFCILMPHTPQEKAVQLADKLRQAIEVFAFPGPKGPLQVTASFGISCFQAGKIDTVKKLFNSADSALYRAKETGRNRVCGYDIKIDKLPDEEGDIETEGFSVD